jgi:inward rectifier potassium channel
MHRIDETSPLYDLTRDDMLNGNMEIVILLGGTDETLSDRIYARHSYLPEDIHWDHRFVDILTMHPSGRRIVDLGRIHETTPLDLAAVGFTDGETERALEDGGASG